MKIMAYCNECTAGKIVPVDRLMVLWEPRSSVPYGIAGFHNYAEAERLAKEKGQKLWGGFNSHCCRDSTFSFRKEIYCYDMVIFRLNIVYGFKWEFAEADHYYQFRKLYIPNFLLKRYMKDPFILRRRVPNIQGSKPNNIISSEEEETLY